MELSSFFKKSVWIFCFIFSTLSLCAFENLSYEHEYFSYSESFQAVPASAPWIVESQHLSDRAKKPEMHPALKGFLRFLIVSVGTLPLTVGLSSLIYLYPPPGWSVSRQTEFALITGASLSLTVGFVDLIVDAIIQGQRKKKD